MSEDGRVLRGIWTVLLVLCGMMLGDHARAACVAEEPAGVLQCITTAYANRDLETFSAMLAPDYVFVSIGPLQQPSQDRNETLKTIRRMFDSPSVERIDLTFAPGFTTIATGPDTWKIENLNATLSLRAIEDGATEPRDFTLDVKMAIHVRLAGSPTPHYEIFREEDFQPE